MFDFIRKAVISHKVEEVKGELQRAGRALQELLMDPNILDKLDSETVWSLLHGLDASFTVLEKTLRTTLGENEEVHPDVRKSLREVQAAVAALRSSVTGLLPLVENVYPQPTKKTQWQLIPPNSQA